MWIFGESKFSSSLLLLFILAATDQIITWTFIIKLENTYSCFHVLFFGYFFQGSPLLCIPGFKNTLMTSSFNWECEELRSHYSFPYFNKELNKLKSHDFLGHRELLWQGKVPHCHPKIQRDGKIPSHSQDLLARSRSHWSHRLLEHLRNFDKLLEAVWTSAKVR